MKMYKLIVIVLFVLSINVNAQYAPAAGQAGSTAINKDSSIFVSWASGATINRGWVNIGDTTMGLATNGGNSNALGIADNSTISLGDGGLAILTFDKPIVDGPSWDFAVFENSFNDFFLELAFVEVSSDGQNFVRFPSHSHTQLDSQVTTFGNLDPTNINNLAGKYRGGFGTPFDLSELANNPNIDIQNINFIRIIDVVGSIDSTFASYDSEVNIINDPFPTPFPSSGFDLDAVGIINQSVGISINTSGNMVKIFPNPCADIVYIKSSSKAIVNIYTILAQLVKNQNIDKGVNKINISDLPKGMYIINIISDTEKLSSRLIVE